MQLTSIKLTVWAHEPTRCEDIGVYGGKLHRAGFWTLACRQDEMICSLESAAIFLVVPCRNPIVSAFINKETSATVVDFTLTRMLQAALNARVKAGMLKDAEALEIMCEVEQHIRYLHFRAGYKKGHYAARMSFLKMRAMESDIIEGRTMRVPGVVTNEELYRVH